MVNRGKSAQLNKKLSNVLQSQPYQQAEIVESESLLESEVNDYDVNNYRNTPTNNTLITK